MQTYGLIGKSLSHSFSQKYFTDKFSRENISDCEYDLFPLNNIGELRNLLHSNNSIVGLNVTIPYKIDVLPFLDSQDQTVQQTQSCNALKIIRGQHDKYSIHGYNTDAPAFNESLHALIGKNKPKALVLGTGGSSRSVQYILNELGIEYTLISRKTSKNRNSIGTPTITYHDLNAEIMNTHKLIINCTPAGMFPEIDNCPNLPYSTLSAEHYLFDLIYNPEESQFLREGKLKGARVKNGLEMLHLQAEFAWKIWNS